MDARNELLELGFAFITHRMLEGSGIRVASLDWEESGGWIYAFVVDGVVKYIGLTGGVLRTRLDQYRSGIEAYGHPTQCGRIKAVLVEQLLEARVIEIYGLRRSGSTQHSLAAEERRLIDAYRGTGLWNRA